MGLLSKFSEAALESNKIFRPRRRALPARLMPPTETWLQSHCSPDAISVQDFRDDSCCNKQPSHCSAGHVRVG